MTDEEKALVERLREMGEHPCRSKLPVGEDLRQAADRIEQLEREKAVVSDLWEQQKEIALGYLADCNALSAEIERLRRALRNIRALATKRQKVCGPDGCLTDIECFARAALAGDSHD